MRAWEGLECVKVMNALLVVTAMQIEVRERERVSKISRYLFQIFMSLPRGTNVELFDMVRIKKDFSL